jgi:transcriptional regulator with XRE-family HTH domain
MEEVLKLLKDALKDRGIKPAHLAKALGISKSWMSKIMKGNATLTVPMLMEIAKKIGVDAGSLIPSKNPRPISFEQYFKILFDKNFAEKSEEMKKEVSKK